MFDLTGKKALVTGASGGLGQAIAKALHARGARLVVSGTRAEVLHALSRELGEGVVALPANLTDAKAVTKLALDASNAMEGIDVLVNNAGITRDNLIVRMSDEEWQTVLRINLEAAFHLSKSVLRGMMKNRWGRIVSITSIVGVTGNPGQANYAASKAGLIGFTKSLAQEVASRNITANCIAPGFIASPMTDVLSEVQMSKLLERIPLAKIGTPHDVAAAVVYLASDEASYVTGQTLHVNGGMAML